MVPKVLTLVPVFIFNENKFHGYINDSNFHESMRHHFSGDNLTAVADAGLARNVIAEELAETRIWTFNNKENLKRPSLLKRLSKKLIVQQTEQVSYRLLTNKCWL